MNGNSWMVATLDAAIVSVASGDPRCITVERGDHPGLPSGPLDPSDRTLDLAVRRYVREQTAVELGYVEQLYTFGDKDRDGDGRSRLLAIGYLALVGASTLASDACASWSSWYRFLPWEDWRAGRPRALESEMFGHLGRWAQEASGEEAERRRERLVRTFGMLEAPWNGEAVLERYELLFEAGLVAEAPAARVALGERMALDHRRILATAIGRLRGKIRYRPVIFELMPESFTLSQLQRTAEAIAGTSLHKQNFRRLVEENGLVEGTGRSVTTGRGRPAELYRFRREVMQERPDPGMRIPLARRPR